MEFSEFLNNMDFMDLAAELLGDLFAVGGAGGGLKKTKGKGAKKVIHCV